MIENLVRQNILRLAPYSCARNEFKGGNDETVFIDANESPFGNVNRYPDPLQLEVKRKLSGIKKVPVANIFLGNGSDEAIDLIYRVFCEPRKDNVVTLSPSYGMYEVCADINDVECRKVTLNPDYSFTADNVLAATDSNTKAIFLCSPNNPTGNVLPPAEVKRVLDGFSGITVIDEAYIDFCPNASWRKALPLYPRLVILSTFSKAWAAAGLRLGMAFASEEIIGYFNKVKYPYNVNMLTQKRALEILGDMQRVDNDVVKILEERRRMAASLQQLPMVEKVYPSQANFLLVKVKDATATYNYLAENNVIVRNRNNVTLCQGCLRITIGSQKENTILLSLLRQAKL